jgi:hypothetical protein
MLRQLYTPEQLAKVVRRRDVWRWKLWESNFESEDKLHEISMAISEDSFSIAELQTRIANGYLICEPSRVADCLALRLVDHYLRRIYKVQQSDRSRIVRQLKVVLEDSSDLELRKLDIRSFYESIDLNALAAKIRGDMILGYKGIRILESLSTQAAKAGCQGLPRGIGVSATLAELVGRTIDRHIRNLEGVYYAARYVDDIIIIAERRKGHTIDASLANLWSQEGLEVNSDKEVTQSFDSAPCFSYLGYEFSVGLPTGGRGPRQVVVRLAPAKMQKQKTKICRAFWQFTRDKSFPSLVARLRYLSMTQLIARSENGRLCAGNAYNYREISDASSFDALDALVRRITEGKSRLGALVEPLLSQERIRQLQRISFRCGFDQNLHVQYTRLRAQRLKRVFRSV